MVQNSENDNSRQLDCIFQTLDSMLDGKMPIHFIPHSIAKKYDDTVDRTPDAIVRALIEIHTAPKIESYIKEMQVKDVDSSVSEKLMPLYRELLFSPSKRMTLRWVTTQVEKDMRWYLQREATQIIIRLFKSELHLAPLFKGVDLIFSNEKIKEYKLTHSHQQELFRLALTAAIKDGFTPNWDIICFLSLVELLSETNDKSTHRSEYMATVITFSQIMRADHLSLKKRIETLTQSQGENGWKMITALYSLLFNRVMFQRYTHPTAAAEKFITLHPDYHHLISQSQKKIIEFNKSLHIFDQEFVSLYKKTYHLRTSGYLKNHDLDELYRIVFPDYLQKVYITKPLSFNEFIPYIFNKKNQDIATEIDSLNQVNRYRQFDELIIKNETLDRKNDKLTRQTEELTHQNQKLTIQTEKLTHQNKELANQNQELTHQNQELTIQNEKLTNQNEELTSQNEELTNQNQKLTSRVEELKRWLKSLRHENQSSASLNLYKSRAERAEQSVLELEQKLSESEQKRSELEQKRSELEQKRSVAEQKVSELEQKVGNLAGQLEQKQKEQPKLAPQQVPAADCIHIDELLREMQEEPDAEKCEKIFNTLSYLLGDKEAWTKNMPRFTKLIREKKRSASKQAATVQNIQYNQGSGTQNNLPALPGKK